MCSCGEHLRRMQVAWARGATMTGSSGAPLIDAASRRAVAVLTGGFATCSSAWGAADFFGRLSSVVRPWRATRKVKAGRSGAAACKGPACLESGHSNSIMCCCLLDL